LIRLILIALSITTHQQLHRQSEEDPWINAKVTVQRPTFPIQLPLASSRMKLSFAITLLAAMAVLASSYHIPQPSSNGAVDTRRAVFRQLVSAGSTVAAVTLLTTTTTSNPANALEACPKGSKNCIATTWTPPSGTNANAAASALKKVIESYPQEGQNNVDLGGWTIVDDSFAPGKVAKLEYKSGIGNFAKFFNGGKPFVDDLLLEVGSDGIVSVRSSSRIGESDLGVNQKRLTYFVSKLRAEGWDAPDPTYF
jgi:Protein of unknown function (DUF1499)